MSEGRGEGGNRDVSPHSLRCTRGDRNGARTPAIPKEGGSWGKHRFPHGSEPEVSDAHALERRTSWIRTSMLATRRPVRRSTSYCTRLRTVEATSARLRPYSTTTLSSIVTPSSALPPTVIPWRQRSRERSRPTRLPPIPTTPYASAAVRPTMWATASREIVIRPRGDDSEGAASTPGLDHGSEREVAATTDVPRTAGVRPQCYWPLAEEGVKPAPKA